MSTDVIKKLLEETEATGMKMDSKNDSFSIAIEQMEEKLKAVQKMQSDVMKFTDGNAKQVQKIQSEWSDAIKMNKTSNKTKDDQKGAQSTNIPSQNGAIASLPLMASKSKTKTPNKTSKSKDNKAATPSAGPEMKNLTEGSKVSKSKDTSVPNKKGSLPKSAYDKPSDTTPNMPISASNIVTARKNKRPAKTHINDSEGASTGKTSSKSIKEEKATKVPKTKKSPGAENASSDIPSETSANEKSDNEKDTKVESKVTAAEAPSETQTAEEQLKELLASSQKGRKKKSNVESQNPNTGEEGQLQSDKQKTPKKLKGVKDQMPKKNQTENVAKKDVTAMKLNSSKEIPRPVKNEKQKSPTFPEGWKKEITSRKSGKKAGMCEIVIKSPTGEKFKNRKQLKKFMDANNDKVFNLLQSGANLDVLYESFSLADTENASDKAPNFATAQPESTTKDALQDSTHNGEKRAKKSQKKSNGGASQKEGDGILYSDTINLPGGWKRAIVVRKSNVRQTSIISPEGKSFSSEDQLRKYIDSNPKVVTKDTNLEVIFKTFQIKHKIFDKSNETPVESTDSKVIPKILVSDKPAKAKKQKHEKVSKEQMVVEAIKSLSERKGSSTKSIKEHIAANYDVKNVGFVKKVLKEGINNNIFQGKKLFKLTSVKQNEPEKASDTKPAKTVKTQIEIINKTSSTETPELAKMQLADPTKKQKRKKSADEGLQHSKKLKPDEIKKMLESEDVKVSKPSEGIKVETNSNLSQFPKVKAKKLKVSKSVQKETSNQLQATCGDKSEKRSEKTKKLSKKVLGAEEATASQTADEQLKELLASSKKGSKNNVTKPAEFNDVSTKKSEEITKISKSKKATNEKTSNDSSCDLKGVPEGWRRGEHTGEDGNKRIFILTPNGKKFWQKTRIIKHLQANPQIQINEESRAILYKAFRKENQDKEVITSTQKEVAVSKKTKSTKKEEKKRDKMELLLKNTHEIVGAPEGWRKGMAEKKDGTGERNFIVNPSGKKFWLKSQMRKYFEQNPQLEINDSTRKILLHGFKQISKEKASQYELIVDAIKGLGKNKGSKKTAIKRYIEDHFMDKVTNLKFLHKALKECVESNKLIQQGKFYKVPKESSTHFGKKRKISKQPKEENTTVTQKVDKQDETLNNAVDEVINKVTSSVVDTQMDETSKPIQHKVPKIKQSHKENKSEFKKENKKDISLNKSIDVVINKVTLVNDKKGKETSAKLDEVKTVKIKEIKPPKTKIAVKSTDLNIPNTTENQENLVTPEQTGSTNKMEKPITDFFDYVEERASNNQKMGKCKICDKVARTDSLKRHIRTTHIREITEA